MLVLPPIRRRIPASHSRASLCSIGAGFMELVISRGTFNPENHELRVQFQLARHIHPRKTRRFVKLIMLTQHFLKNTAGHNEWRTSVFACKNARRA